jgi:putative endonuclease
LIRCRNYIYRGAEIDIIAQNKDMIVFVEVKSKTTNEFGSPEEMVTFYKQRQIKKAALSYTVSQNNSQYDYRFDVIAITFYNKKPLIKHIENAF